MRPHQRAVSRPLLVDRRSDAVTRLEQVAEEVPLVLVDIAGLAKLPMMPCAARTWVSISSYLASVSSSMIGLRSPRAPRERPWSVLQLEMLKVIDVDDTFEAGARPHPEPAAYVVVTLRRPCEDDGTGQERDGRMGPSRILIPAADADPRPILALERDVLRQPDGHRFFTHCLRIIDEIEEEPTVSCDHGVHNDSFGFGPFGDHE